MQELVTYFHEFNIASVSFRLFMAMIAGALTYKFVVVPAAAKFKNWRENRKAVVTQPKDDIVDGEFMDLDEETEEDSE